MSDGPRRPNIGLLVTVVAVTAATIAYLYANVNALNQRESDADHATNGRLDRLEQARFTKAQRLWALVTAVVGSLVVVLATTHPHISF